MDRFFLSVVIFIIFIGKVHSQASLPNFSAEDLGKNKIRISWVNQYGEACIQLTVQASIDSLRGFKTIFSTESPQLPQNGFVYTLPFNAKFYYRISYILEGNAFYFTASKNAVPGAIVQGPEKILEKNEATKVITIKKYDTVVAVIPYEKYKAFKDSMVRRTKDTLYIVSQDQIVIKPYNPFNYYRPSVYVVNNPDGFIEIKLPDAATKDYKIIFFDTDGKRLFTINKITDTDLVIDKSNFQHAGWFTFELYEDGNLKEKNKVLLQKDF